MSVFDKSKLGSPAGADYAPMWETLHRIQITLGVDDVAMSDMMHLTTKEFRRLRTMQRDVRVTAAMYLSDAVNVGFVNLMKNEIDYIALARQFQGDKQYVPEKYQVAAFSRRRIAIKLLEYVGQSLGWERRALLLKSFQMTESMFADPDAWINMRFSTDVVNWMHQHCKSEKVLFDLGNEMMLAHRHGPVGEAVAGARNLTEFYEIMLGGVLERFLEKNFKWWIHSMNQSVLLVRGAPIQDVVDLVGAQYVKTEANCIVRKGIFSAMPEYMGYLPAFTEKTACVAKGDPFCQFKLDFEMLERVQRLRIVQSH